MTLDQILRKYMAREVPDIRLKKDFKLYLDSDGDIVYQDEESERSTYFEVGTASELPELIEFILNEVGVK